MFVTTAATEAYLDELEQWNSAVRVDHICWTIWMRTHPGRRSHIDHKIQDMQVHILLTITLRRVGFHPQQSQYYCPVMCNCIVHISNRPQCMFFQQKLATWADPHEKCLTCFSFATAELDPRLPHAYDCTAHDKGYMMRCQCRPW